MLAEVTESSWTIMSALTQLTEKHVKSALFTPLRFQMSINGMKEGIRDVILVNRRTKQLHPHWTV